MAFDKKIEGYNAIKVGSLWIWGDSSNNLRVSSSEPNLTNYDTTGTIVLSSTQSGYTTPVNLTTVRTFDANATTVEELADVLGTLIEDLKAGKYPSA